MKQTAKNISQIMGPVLLGALLFIAGCSTHSGKYQSSSVVSLLYSEGKEAAPMSDEIELQTPLSVGIAFVPSAQRYGFPSEMELLAAAEEVRRHFAHEKGVKRIQIIPSYHLQTRKGFDGLAELGRMYQVDVMALISYDQVVSENTNSKSFWYLTVVGAYLVDGQEAAVQTFMETTVFDLKSRQMLFSAAGYDKRKSTGNMSNAERNIESNQSASFQAAVGQMNANLAVALEQFKADIKEDGRVKVAPRLKPNATHDKSHGGKVTLGGSLPEFVIFGSLALVLLRLLVRKTDRLASAMKMKSK